MIKQCIICGREFNGYAQRRYCDECSKAVCHTTRKTTVEIGAVMKCERCGKEIIRTCAAKRYCADCHQYVQNHYRRLKNAQKK